MTDQAPVERQPAQAPVHRPAEPVRGQPAHQLGHRQELDTLDEAKPGDLLFEVARIVDALAGSTSALRAIDGIPYFSGRMKKTAVSSVADPFRSSSDRSRPHH